MLTIEDSAKQPREQRMRPTRSGDDLAAAIEGQSAGAGLAAFRQRRAETLEIFGKLTPAQWEKGGQPPRPACARATGTSVTTFHDRVEIERP